MADLDSVSKEVASRRRSRNRVFIYQLFWLVGLLVVAMFYMKGSFGTFFNGVPRAAFFAVVSGALGGVMVGLKGVYDYPIARSGSDKNPERPLWTNELLPWHFGHPFSGMAVGASIYILLHALAPNGTPATATISATSLLLATQDKAYFAYLRGIAKVIVSIPQKDTKAETTIGQSRGGDPPAGGVEQ